MANDVTLTTTGKQAYDDFAGQTDDDSATFSDYTYAASGAASGKNYKVRTQDSQKCIQPEDNTFSYENHYFRKTWANANKELFISRIFYPSGTYDRQQMCFYKGFGASGAWNIENLISNTANWSANRFGAHTTPREITSGAWLLVQTWISETLNEYGVWLLSDMSQLTGQKTRYKTGFALDTTSQNYDFAYDSRGGTLYVGKMLQATSRYITVTGLTAGMAVELLDASDNLIDAKYASTTSVTFDLMGKLPPVSYKFKVYGTDASVMVTTAAQTIYPGDSWAYSGDTAGASGGGAINVINNNM